ncbi:MAG: tRNA threonylcarbamoyladenosine dehydratase [Muribaculaceae bacterium]|nr:tRNA threonylcarbamoyladenosine dehydratase [Muribaculaceae bacterium]
MTNSHIFDRAELLLGEETMRRLEKTRVIVFGVGGVGSWCAESLIRSGIGHLTIVDNDTVSPTNINRQLMAIPANIGRVKVEALGEILKSINPEAEIECRNEVYSAATAGNFHLEDYDYIIDCIDSLSDKALLIERATATPATLYSSMGAALKLDPTRIKVAEFWDVKGCPLARALRQRFKRSGLFPKKKFKCVYSDELLSNAGVVDPSDSSQLESYGSTRKAGINGSLHHITSIFGITIAGLLIRDVSIKGK